MKLKKNDTLDQLDTKICLIYDISLALYQLECLCSPLDLGTKQKNFYSQNTYKQTSFITVFYVNPTNRYNKR